MCVYIHTYIYVHTDVIWKNENLDVDSLEPKIILSCFAIIQS